MGKGVFAQSSVSLSGCPALIGCSIECKSKSDSRLSFSKASSGENAPLASTRISISAAENCRRIYCNKSSSSLKLIAPILSLMTLKPACNFSLICRNIKSLLPIHIKPFMGIPVMPAVKSDG